MPLAFFPVCSRAHPNPRLQTQKCPTLKQDKQLERAIDANKNYVTSEVLAENILFVDTNPQGEPLSFDDIKTEIRLDKTN